MRRCRAIRRMDEGSRTRGANVSRPHAGASPQVWNDALCSLRVVSVAGMELRKSGFLDARFAIEDDGERDEDDPPPRRRVADAKARGNQQHGKVHRMTNVR